MAAIASANAIFKTFIYSFLDKDEKNRIKTDLANLRRCLRKDKPEKMNENEEAALRQAKTQMEESANHLMVLYTSEQGTDGTNNAL